MSLSTLGSAELAGDAGSRRVVVFGPGKPLALLVYLSASPGRMARREHLQDLLWADMEPEAGRHALRQLVYFIRQKAGDILEPTREALRLADDVASDREELLVAAESQDCSRVIDLYRGEFLPALGLPGGGQFEQWADVERQRLRASFLRCGDAVARRWLAEGRHRDAITLARRLRDADPHSEAGWRLLIEGLLSASDHLGAGSEADSLTRLLREEEREPEPSTLALIRRASATPPHVAANAAGHVLASELIGRAEQFGALVSAWDDARRQHHRHVHIVAPAGIGKSRLIADFAARLRAKGARIARVDVRPGDRQLPQSAMGDLAAALARLPGAAGISPGAARCIVALHPPLSSEFAAEADLAAGEEGVRRRAIALHELMSAVADEAPVAVLIDDVHWMDDVSRRMLISVLQRIQSERILVVTASRPRYPAVSSPDTTEIMLHPLTVPQVGALVASVASLPDEPWASRFPEELHRAADGSPLLTLETLQLLLDRGLIALDDARWTTSNPLALMKLLSAGSALGARIEQLDASHRELLLALAVAGLAAPLALLAGTLEAAPADIEPRLASLEHRGLLLQSADGWQPSHDAIGEFALTSVDAGVVRVMHRRWGHAYLARQEADAQASLRAARHFAAAEHAQGLRDAFVRWLAGARRRGDHRPLGQLANDFAAGDPSIPSTMLARGVPIHLRYSRRALTGSGIGALLIVGAASLISTQSNVAPPPDAALLAVFVDSTRDTVLVSVPLRNVELSARDPIVLRHLPRAAGLFPLALIGARLAPDSAHWLRDVVYPDSGRFDVALQSTRTGHVRRLTSADTDQNASSWSPDGRWIVFRTGEYHAMEHADLATLDLATGHQVQLTSSDHSDWNPVWHPSGTSIAFARTYWDDASKRADICSVLVDGSETECYEPPGLVGALPLGWFDDDWLIVTAPQSDDLQGFGLVKLRTRETRRLGSLVGQAAQASADGQWISCLCRPSSNPRAPLRNTVFAVDRPDVWRQIVVDELSDAEVRVVWSAPRPPRRHVAALRVDSFTTSVLAPGRIHAIATDVSGRVVDDIPLRWRSLTPEIAHIDPVTGTLQPNRIGVARVRVSAGGWISSERDIRVENPIAQDVLRERWEQGLEHFALLGQPRSSLVHHDALGPALAINGDNRFSSGVFSRDLYDARQGLGLEAVVRLPLTANQWQALTLELIPAASDKMLLATAGDDFVRGIGHPWPRTPTCLASVPGGEGAAAMGRMSAMNGSYRHAPLDARYTTGHPFRLLVQLFPDGSCGVAVDGKPVFWIPGPAPATSSYRVAMYGMSVGTTIAVGATRVWKGVRPGIDWRPLNSRSQ